MKYNPKEFEENWQKKWLDSKIYAAEDFADKEKYYVLVEFPYPSGPGMHIGHSRNYSMMDSVARLRRMMGYNVLYPMGWDAFGLPTENYAIKVKKSPREVTDTNVANFRRQLKSLGLSFDWDREIDTTDPKYYKWTQWIFLKLYEKGLAEKVEMPINWCPQCHVGCANEEVIDGKHERCGGEVEKRMKSQWVLKITEYADRLVDELDLVDYPKSVVASQRNWIGRKEGIEIDFEVVGSDIVLPCFTTTPVNWGATFLVIAPEHPLTAEITADEQQGAVSAYVSKAAKKSSLERMAGVKHKTGVFTGSYVTNHINGDKLPVWVADFVLADFGTGIVQGCPAHDERDYDFATKFKLPIVRVVEGINGETDKGETAEVDPIKTGGGEMRPMVNSDFLNGIPFDEAMVKTMDYFVEKGWGRKTVTYSLNDWIFSRQRYWGEPVPMVHCEKCGTVPVPEDQLPVVLPEVEAYEPTDDGESPLAAMTDWVNTTCPNCDGPAKRETDTMPNWAGSSWYFLRYIDPHNDKMLADPKKLEYWMPIDIYEGGAEHTTLHVLYSRFWHKFLNDIGVVPGKEPYGARRTHGVVLAEDGKKMSKSVGNVINPDEMIEEFGADTARAYLLFMGPYEGDNSWNAKTVQGVARFLRRYFVMLTENAEKPSKETDPKVEMAINKLAVKVRDDILGFKFNTSIAGMMEFLKGNSKAPLTRDQVEKLAIIIAPIAPHLAEEVWKILGNEFSVHSQSWPEVDESKLVEETVEIAIQINGKVRDRVEIAVDASETDVRNIVLSMDKIVQELGGKEPKKFVYVPGRIISIVK